MVAKTRELDVVNINLATSDDFLESKYPDIINPDQNQARSVIAGEGEVDAAKAEENLAGK